jgi:hypothetical protein
MTTTHPDQPHRKAIIKHLCHARNCTADVQPRMFMCRKHWYMLPKKLRDGVWAAYVPGQGIRKDPTGESLATVREAIAVVAESEKEAAIGSSRPTDEAGELPWLT